MMQRAIERLRGEFLEMPGLRLTVPQAERLCGIDRTICKAVLDALVDAHFLSVSPDGVYRRAFDDDVHHVIAPRRHAGPPRTTRPRRR